MASIKQLYKVASSKAERKQAESAKANLKTLLQEHQTIEQQYRKQTADRVARQYRIVKPDASQQEIDQAVNSDNPQVFTQALLNTNRMGQARGAYREVQDRHVEIQKIERTMGELAQMFNEMSMLVEQQDEAITHVEAQTQQVDSDIARGNTEIDGAIIKAKKARRKKWICFWIISECLLLRVADPSSHHPLHCWYCRRCHGRYQPGKQEELVGSGLNLCHRARVGNSSLVPYTTHFLS